MLSSDFEIISSENSSVKLVLPSKAYEESYASAIAEIKNIQDPSQKEYMSEFDISNCEKINDFQSDIVSPLLSKQTTDRPLDEEGHKLAPGFSFWIIKTDEQGKENFCGEILVCPRRLSKIEQKMPSVKKAEIWDGLCDREADDSIAPRGAVCSYYLRPSAQGREQNVSKTIAPFLGDVSKALNVPQFTFACVKNNAKSKGILDKLQTQYGGTRFVEGERYRYFVNTHPMEEKVEHSSVRDKLTSLSRSAPVGRPTLQNSGDKINAINSSRSL